MGRQEGKTIFDWDGTVSEVAQTFVDPYVAELAKKTGINESELAEQIMQTRQVIINAPEKYGWFINGQRVSWATDTYLITQAAAKEILKQMNMVPNPEMLTQIHHHARSMMDLVFQPDVGKFIEAMKQSGGAVIVTNSGTKEVTDEIKALMGSDPGVEVVGGAKKFVVDLNWDGWQEKMEYFWVKPDCYPNGMSLKRPYYVDILSGIGQIKWVIGDLSMDLLVPDAMGISTALKKNEHTPYFEINYFDRKNSGRYLINEYSQAMEWAV